MKRHEQKKQKSAGWLSQTFKLAASGYLLAHAVHIGSSFLLPGAPDIIVQQGVSPAQAAHITAQLSDRSIRVREKNRAGMLHGALGGALNFSAKEIRLAADPKAAYAVTGLQTTLFGLCYTTMTDANMSMRDKLIDYLYLPPETVTHNPVSARDSYLLTAFHEYRHCHSDNDFGTTVLNEADADLKALEAIAMVSDNPEIGRAWLYFRALALHGTDHDTALFLYYGNFYEQDTAQHAAMAAESQQGVKAIEALYPDATRQLTGDERWRSGQWDGRDLHLRTQLLAARTALAERQDLSDHARKRIELFIEAAEYYGPSLRTTPMAPQQSARWHPLPQPAPAHS